ncbi:MAG: hypothetical protein EBY80_13555 [Actinobacteria bacterium]|jgi:hypothetical protein|nr:hypothetical protein [Actinomycetota bacterium]NDA79110.1 hypothetical protein [Actinomycetota bacterium]NDD98323.1 hypothetical protein [Actinomycetota bacterium]NDE81746.1 hypothetical protein [Actinomycetota bacterium]
MYIRIRNTRDRKFASALKTAVNIMSQHLFSKQMLPYLSFTIQVMDKLDVNGYCCPADLVRPREFEIEIQRRKHKLDMIGTLAHEMVHAKQFAYGELRDRYLNKRMVTLWHGQYPGPLSYWEQPWEIEAFGLEPSLVARFLNQSGLYAYFKTSRQLWAEDNT